MCRHLPEPNSGTPEPDPTSWGPKAACERSPSAPLSSEASPVGTPGAGQPRGLHEPPRHAARVPGEPRQVPGAAGQVGGCLLVWLTRWGLLGVSVTWSVHVCKSVIGSVPGPPPSGKLEPGPPLTSLRVSARTSVIRGSHGEATGKRLGLGQTLVLRDGAAQPVRRRNI